MEQREKDATDSPEEEPFKAKRGKVELGPGGWTDAEGVYVSRARMRALRRSKKNRRRV